MKNIQLKQTQVQNGIFWLRCVRSPRVNLTSCLVPARGQTVSMASCHKLSGSVSLSVSLCISLSYFPLLAPFSGSLLGWVARWSPAAPGRYPLFTATLAGREIPSGSNQGPRAESHRPGVVHLCIPRPEGCNALIGQLWVTRPSWSPPPQTTWTVWGRVVPQRKSGKLLIEEREMNAVKNNTSVYTH